MKKFSKLAVFAMIVLVLSTVSVGALAATNKTPADIVAGLTGKTTESVIKERSDSGKTYGTIAKDAGKLTEFKAQMIATREEALKELVKAGKITQERADAIIAAMKANQANCDGTGIGMGQKAGAGLGASMGQKAGAGFGAGMGNGQGRGQGGQGCAQGGAGMGRGVCDGSCVNK